MGQLKMLTALLMMMMMMKKKMMMCLMKKMMSARVNNWAMQRTMQKKMTMEKTQMEEMKQPKGREAQ